MGAAFVALVLEAGRVAAFAAVFVVLLAAARVFLAVVAAFFAGVVAFALVLGAAALRGDGEAADFFARVDADFVDAARARFAGVFLVVSVWVVAIAIVTYLRRAPNGAG
ncbi:MAG: hypothetical protein AAF850_06540 [Pseudomonadota bacterium]